jgi:FkbM family methyltransferase
MTPEQAVDCQSVWEQMEKQYPEFTHACDPTNNWYAVREIILGGSLPWAGANKRFQPFPGAKVMDLGANVGIYTAYCALHGAKVTAYEPDPSTFTILAEMVSNAGLQAILVNKAVWTGTERVPFYGHGDTSGGRLQRNGAFRVSGCGHWDRTEEEGAFVESVSFDDAVGDVDWDCIKMDIEGAEFEVLLNAAPETLRRIKFAFVEIHPWANQILYDETMARLDKFFTIESGSTADTGRYDSLYLTANHE